MSGWVDVNRRGKGEWQGGVARREGQMEEGRKGELMEGELQIGKEPTTISVKGTHKLYLAFCPLLL